RDPRAVARDADARRSRDARRLKPMDKFQIDGGQPLDGEVRISGAKNATLPILAATLLGDGPSTIANVPRLQDVITMQRLLEGMGVAVAARGDGRVTIDPRGTAHCVAPYE